MARKTLLTEGEIRQFMKLASLQPIGAPRLEEMGYSTTNEQEEDDPMGLDVGEEPGAPLGDVELDVPEVGGDEMGDEMSADEPATEATVGELVQALVDTISEIVPDVDISVDGAGEELPVDDLGPEGELGEPALEPEGEPALGLDVPEEEEEVVPGMRDVYENQEDVVNEVARRVVARLTQEKKGDDLANQLAERIFNRLTK
jgi:hypothetical protein